MTDNRPLHSFRITIGHAEFEELKRVAASERRTHQDEAAMLVEDAMQDHAAERGYRVVGNATRPPSQDGTGPHTQEPAPWADVADVPATYMAQEGADETTTHETEDAAAPV